jgi:hypothetical protein
VFRPARQAGVNQEAVMLGALAVGLLVFDNLKGAHFAKK